MKRFFYVFIIFIWIFYSCQNQKTEDLNLKHVNHIANSINADLNSIKSNVFYTANFLQHRVPFDKKVRGFSKDFYQFSSDKALISKYNESKSAVYCPADITISSQLKKIIINSEVFDSLFISSIKKNPLISQLYFLDTNSFLRIYPYIDVTTCLKPDINLKGFAPYQTANNKPFINDEAYWINKPFADPYGRGWIISCIEPIYYRDQFIGILSGDIALQGLKKKYFSSGTELLLLIDQKGKIICCTKEAGKLANIPQLREFGYYKTITEDIYDFDNPNLTDHKNKSLSKAIKSLLSGENIENFYVDNNKYTIYKSIIKETDWLLLKIIN
ncbi:MAG: PDC sensor domain-containing protein [Bacteroidales bacterium]|jgi:hypothetical protein|nr:PDC sensor domain-containing protein [Bacteroidales bacterium]